MPSTLPNPTMPSAGASAPFPLSVLMMLTLPT
jgi:hypothetical protein